MSYLARETWGREQERSEVDLSCYLSETRDFACFLGALLWVQLISPTLNRDFLDLAPIDPSYALPYKSQLVLISVCLIRLSKKI